MAYNFGKALLPRRWETLGKNVIFVLAHSLSSTRWCVCLVLGWLGSTQTLITLDYITLHSRGRPLHYMYLNRKHSKISICSQEFSILRHSIFTSYAQLLLHFTFPTIVNDWKHEVCNVPKACTMLVISKRFTRLAHLGCSLSMGTRDHSLLFFMTL